MKTLLLLLCCCWGPVWLSVIQTETKYHSWPRSWNSARRFCRREHSADLQIVRTAADFNISIDRYYAWFGLHRPSPRLANATFTSPYWHWVDGTNATGSIPGFHRTPRDNENCAAAMQGSQARVGKCSTRHFSFCQDSAGTVTFINRTMNWWNALDNCRAMNQTLARFHPKYKHSPARVHRDFNVWTRTRYSGPGEDLCVAVSSQSRLLSLHSCDKSFPFLCDRHNLLLQTEELNWDEAVEHCMNLSSSRLLSVDQDHLQYALGHASRGTTSKVWVGLRFLAGSWFWSDGVPVSLSLPSCPEFACGALVVNSSSLEPTDCSQKLNLLCYTEP